MMTSSEEIVQNVLERSSQLLENLSTQEPAFHRTTIKTHIEALLNVEKTRIGIDFQPGLDWINAEPISLSVRKIKVLDFFTYCCVNCIHILPQLKALESKYPIEDGLVVIGVHSPKFGNEHATANVRAAVSRYEITHPVVNDHEEHLWNTLGITCWPTLVLLGPNNELLLYLMGETHQEVLHLFVEEALKVFKERNSISLGSTEISTVNEDSSQKALEGQSLYFPGKVTVTQSAQGLLVAIADTARHRVLVTDKAGVVQHIIGCGKSGFKDGSFSKAQFHSPQGLVFTNSSTLYVADTENHALRKIDLSAGNVETVVGDGSQGQDLAGGKIGAEQPISSPWDVVVLNPSTLLIAMAGSHQVWAYFIQDNTLWKKQYTAGTCAAVVGSGREENRNNSYPMRAGLAQPSGLTISADGSTVYVADSESSTVRAVSVADGRVAALVGGLPDPLNLFAFGDVDGKGYEARLQHPLGVTWSEYKQVLYVCDSYNHKLKMVVPSSRQCSTISDHVFNEPGGLCAVDNLIYIADTNNHCVKIVDVDTMYVEKMTITIKNSDVKTERAVSAPVQQAQVNVNTDGGTLKLHISISVSDNIKPLPESPAEWTLTLPEGWNETQSSDQGRLEMTWTLAVPSAETTMSHQLKPQCRLFYCRDSLCSRRTLQFLVTATYSDSAPTCVTCSVPFVFTL